MALSSAEITKLASRAESLLVSALDVHNTMNEIEKGLQQAISCIDSIILNAPSDLRFDFVLRQADMLCRAISWEDGAIPWRWLTTDDTSSDLLSDFEIKRLGEKAGTFLADKKFKEALCYYSTIIKYSSPQAYFFSQKADCFIGIGNIAAAIDAYSHSIELDPHQAKYYKKRAICKEALSPSDKMSGELTAGLLADYKTAMQKDPIAADVWMSIIYLTMLQNDWDEVISLCGQSQSYINDPNDKALRAWILCLALTLSGDTVAEEDLRPLREAQRVEGAFIGSIIDHLLNLCEDSKVQEQTKKQLLELNSLLLLRMSDLDLGSQLCISLDLYEEALKLLEKKLEQTPEDDKAWERKCEVLAKLGRLDDTYQKNPASPEAWLGAIANALLLGDWNEAINRCQESGPFVTHPQDKADRAWYLCLALALAGKPVPEVELIKATQSKKTNGVVFNHFVQKVKEMSEESTLQIERKNILLDMLLKPVVNRITNHAQPPNDNNIYPILAQKADLLSRLGRYEEELAVRLLIMQPMDFPFPGNWIKLSDCYRNLSKYPEALEAAEKAMKWGPTCSEAWLATGKCLEKMTRYQEALNAYSKAAAPNPDDYYSKDLPGKNIWAPYALKHKIALLFKLGNFHDELIALDQLFGLVPDWVTINLIDEIIEYPSHTGIDILGDAWYQKARLLSFTGDRAHAAIYLSKAIESDPKKQKIAAGEELLKDLLQRMP